MRCSRFLGASKAAQIDKGDKEDKEDKEDKGGQRDLGGKVGEIEIKQLAIALLRRALAAAQHFVYV